MRELLLRDILNHLKNFSTYPTYRYSPVCRKETVRLISTVALVEDYIRLDNNILEQLYFVSHVVHTDGDLPYSF